MKISIVTPNYNYAQFLPKTIESVIEQSFKELEYIIIDDGSNDDSVSIIESYAKKHPFIKLKKHENQGQTFTLTKGLGVSTGEIICLINPGSYLLRTLYLGKTILEPYIANMSLRNKIISSFIWVCTIMPSLIAIFVLYKKRTFWLLFCLGLSLNFLSVLTLIDPNMSPQLPFQYISSLISALLISEFISRKLNKGKYINDPSL